MAPPGSLVRGTSAKFPRRSQTACLEKRQLFAEVELLPSGFHERPQMLISTADASGRGASGITVNAVAVSRSVLDAPQPSSRASHSATAKKGPGECLRARRLDAGPTLQAAFWSQRQACAKVRTGELTRGILRPS